MSERADAMRNRAAILVAAERLIAERGIDAISVNDVAEAAGVGKGTVFRRFGDKEGLIQAVVEQRAAQWHAYAQLVLENGEVSAKERVTDFAGRLFDHVIGSLPLVIALERVAPRSNGEDYERTHERLAGLIAEVRGVKKAPYLAHALLANLRGEQIEFLLAAGMPLKEVRAGVLALAEALMGSGEREFRWRVIPGGADA